MQQQEAEWILLEKGWRASQKQELGSGVEELSDEEVVNGAVADGQLSTEIRRLGREQGYWDMHGTAWMWHRHGDSSMCSDWFEERQTTDVPSEGFDNQGRVHVQEARDSQA